MKYIVFFIFLAILLLAIERIMMKIFKVKRQKLSETRAKKIDQWGRGIMFIIFLISIWFVVQEESLSLTKLYFMLLLGCSTGFQVVMEFIFLRKSKQYISTTVLLVIGLIMIYNIDKLSLL